MSWRILYLVQVDTQLTHVVYRTMVRLQQVHFPSLADLSDEMRTAVCANVVDVEEVLALLGKAVCDKVRPGSLIVTMSEKTTRRGCGEV